MLQLRREDMGSAKGRGRLEGTRAQRYAPEAAGRVGVDDLALGGASPLQLAALEGAVLQLRAAIDGHGAAPDPHRAASEGTRGAGGALPYQDRIQASFGRHDVSGVRAHTDARAQAASRELGASAFATGDHVAFGGAPDLHTAAHEAAHVVQQRGGVQLAGGVGREGDAYERHADEVADLVVQGKSAEGLLDRHAGTGAGRGGAVQRKEEKADPPHKDEIKEMSGRELDKAVDNPPGHWTEDDIAYAKEQLHELRRNLKPGKSKGKKKVAAPGKELVIEQEVGDVTTTKKTERTIKAPRGSHRSQRHVTESTSTKKESVDDEGTVSVEHERDETTEEAPNERLSTNVEVSSKATLTDGDKRQGEVAWAKGEWRDSVGPFEIVVTSSALSASAEAEHTGIAVNVKGDDKKGSLGAETSAKAGAKANLIDFKAVLTGGWDDIPLFDETIGLGINAGVEGSVGVEGSAEIKSNLMSVASQAKTPAPHLEKGLSAKGEAFAGAKLKLWAGGHLDWHKKAAGSYSRQMRDAIGVLIGLAGGGLVGAPILQQLMAYLEADAALADLAVKVLGFGSAGKTTVIALEYTLAGTAGIGAKASGEIGYSNGKIKLKGELGLTKGVGKESGLNLLVDIVQFPLFCLVNIGELGTILRDNFADKVQEWVGKLAEFAHDVLPDVAKALVEDDVAETRVEAGAHKTMSASERGKLIGTMVDLVVVGDTEDAILEVLEFSKDKGELVAVIKAMTDRGTSIVDLCEAIDGDNFRMELDEAMHGAGWRWVTRIGKLTYPYGGKVWTDEPTKGPYVYFNKEEHAEESKENLGDGIEGTVAPSHNQTDPDWRYFLQLQLRGWAKADSFHKLDCKDPEDLNARFSHVSWAFRNRHGGSGIWLE